MVSKLLEQTGISLERLQSFCLVAEAGGLTKAARGNPAKQSLFSRQIKELEGFFGTELMHRMGRGIVLTPAGERLNVIARECFASLLDFKTESTGMPLEIVIGAGESLIRWHLLPHLVQIQKNMPNVRLKFLNLPTSEIARRLSDGLLDFGVIRKEAISPPLRLIPLGAVGYSLFLSSAVSSKRTSADDVSLLESLPIATLEGSGNFRQQLATIEQKLRITLDVRLECSSFPLVASALNSGDVAAILPSIAKIELAQFGIEQVELPALKDFDREICLAWNPRLFQIRAALERVCEVMAKAFLI